MAHADCLVVEELPIDSLVPNERNPRVNDRAVDAVARSITAFGFNNPIVTDGDLRIAAGHTRLKAARKLGMATVPVIRVPGLVGSKFAGFSIADNRVAEIADWDEDMLGELLTELNQQADFDLSNLGFSENELSRLIARDDGKDDEVPDPPVVPVTQPGDLWVLGDHRLLCGDATKAEDVARLMGIETAQLCLTDPPYGINIVRGISTTNGAKPFGRVRQPGGRPSGVLKGKVGRPSVVQPRLYAPIYGDDKPFDPTPLLGIAANHIVFGGIYFNHKLPQGTAWICWDKGVSDEATFSAFELAWTSHEGRHRMYRHTWSGMVRSGPRAEELRDRVHPTQKPVGLFAAILADYSQPGDIVLDPFLGSGTTLIACEREGRRCYAMEIDPGYCDVAVERWEQFTGGKAERVGR